MKNSNKRNNGSSYGSGLGYAIFHLMIKYVGPSPAYALLVIILPYYLLLRGSVRRTTDHYIKRRFPGRGRIARFFLATRYIYEFGKVLIDQAAIGLLKDDSFNVKFHGGEEFYALAQKECGMVLLTSHVGSWQTAMATMRHLEKKINFLFEVNTDAALHFFNLAQNKEKFSFISPSLPFGGLVEATNAINDGEVVSIMGDRAWGARTRKAAFLGEDAEFPVTPYYLVAATGADLVILLTVRTGKMSFEMEARHISAGTDWVKMPREEVIATLLSRYVECLEEYLGRYPFMWFNFMDFWSTRDENT